MAAVSRFVFGEVVLVPVPFIDQLRSKKRPAVVGSSSSYGANRRDIVIVTSATRPGGAVERR